MTRATTSLGLAACLASGLVAGCAESPRGEVPGAEDTAPPLPGIVSASTPEGVAAAVEILDRGGNAVDAGLAAAFALMVTEPAAAGLGGEAVVLFAPAQGSVPLVIDAPGDPAAPAGSTSAIPTAAAVLEETFQRFASGRVTWRALVDPAIRYAEEGFRIGRTRHRAMVIELDRIRGDSAAASVFLREGIAAPTQEQVVIQPALAASLRSVAEEGAATLGSGRLGARIGAMIPARATGAPSRAGGPSVRVRESVQARFRGATIHLLPEPYGGNALLRGLTLLGRADPELLRDSPRARLLWTTEALGYALGSSARSPEEYLEGRIPLPAPAGTGMSPDSPGRTAATEQGAGTAPASGRGRPLQDPGPIGQVSGLPSTLAGVVVVGDGEGNLVMITMSLGSPFGAARMVPGTGIVLNDLLATPPTHASAVVDTGTERVALAAGGGSSTVSATLQVVRRLVDEGLPIEEAVQGRRLHRVDGVAGIRVFLEGVDPLVRTPLDTLVWGRNARGELARRGWALGVVDSGLEWEGFDPFYGRVAGVVRAGEEWNAAADPRSDGSSARTTGIAPLTPLDGEGS